MRAAVGILALDRFRIVSLNSKNQMGDCQNYGPSLGPHYKTGPNTGPNLGEPKRDHNFDNPPNRNASWKRFSP